MERDYTPRVTCGQQLWRVSRTLVWNGRSLCSL